MIKNVERLYSEAMELAEVSKTYLEENMYTRAAGLPDAGLADVNAITMITCMLTNITSFLLMTKAYEKGEIPKEQVMESASSIMGEMVKMQMYTSDNEEIKQILARLDVLMLRVKEMIVN